LKFWSTDLLEFNLITLICALIQLISDLGLLIPGMEEANYLCSITTVYMARFSYVSPDDIKIKNKQWIGELLVLGKANLN